MGQVQLGWVCKLGGAESLVISKAKLMDSQIWHQFPGSVTLWGEGSEKVQ